ncbi:MAG TPA: hypothetical protein VGO16_00920 [Pseudonocardiaceae bacterium]|nr:hypothetical protein [Pseudonocardiaceae bacterium]
MNSAPGAPAGCAWWSTSSRSTHGVEVATRSVAVGEQGGQRRRRLAPEGVLRGVDEEQLFTLGKTGEVDQDVDAVGGRQGEGLVITEPPAPPQQATAGADHQDPVVLRCDHTRAA